MAKATGLFRFQTIFQGRGGTRLVKVVPVQTELETLYDRVVKVMEASK